MSIAAQGGVNAPVLEKTVVRIPDPTQIAVLSLTRPFLIKKTTNLTFVGGDLKKVDFTKPSEALAVVSIPASITAKVAEAIPEIIKIQDSRANAGLAAEKARLDAQKGVIDSQLAVRNSQKALSDSIAGNGVSASLDVSASSRTFLTAKERKARAKAAELEAEASEMEAEVRKRKAKATLDTTPAS